MSDFDTRLRETLDHVAASTKVSRRVDEIVLDSRRRPQPRFAAAVAAFVLVGGVFALPLLLSDPPTDDVAGGPAPHNAAGGRSAPEGSSVVIEPDWLTVEPGDVAAFEEIPLPGAGERASLRSETVWCFYEEGRPIETRASSVAVDQPVTTDDLASACITHPETTASDLSSESMTVCRGVFDPSVYEEWASSGEMTVISGGVEGSHPGFPVVLAWQSDCNSQTVTSHPTVALTDDLSVDAVNRARQLELAAVAAAIRNCLSYDESQALAKAAVGELGQQWIHASIKGSDELTEGCFQPFIDQQWGWVITDIVRDEPSTSVTTTTDPTS